MLMYMGGSNEFVQQNLCREATTITPCIYYIAISNTYQELLTLVQSWGRYFENVTSYILLVTFRQCN